MPLIDALEAFFALLADQQGAAGIGLNEPIRMVVDGREAFVGWYNAAACRFLVQTMSSEQ
jgi:hypothetical protein